MTTPEPLTPETRAIVDALHKHQEAITTLLDSGEHGPGCSPSIVRVMRRAIARLVLLDTRLEALKRRKPDASPSTAADRTGRSKP